MSSYSLFPQVAIRQSRTRKSLPATIFFNSPSINPLVNYNDMVQNITLGREIICDFFLNLVQKKSPEIALAEFEKLFINPVAFFNSEAQKALRNIVMANQEEEFKNTFKRCIYILLNNWIFRRKYQPALDLMELLCNSVNLNNSSSQSLTTLKTWIVNFLNSTDYEELKLFVSKYDQRNKNHWKSRYTSYLLASQYANNKNLLEQREAAKSLSKQLQEEFKFDLAMYAAFSQCRAFNKRKIENPTALGAEAMRLIQTVVAKRGPFSYANLANIFINQTQQLKYIDFKESLVKYLIFSKDNREAIKKLKIQLANKLQFLYVAFNQEQLNKDLILKTCNRVIEYLTTEKNAEPSSLFIALASQGNPLTLAILLLKVILICPSSRTHLEVCMANLIQQYENNSPEECYWVINFLEITKIILTIYTENVQYNLVNMEPANLVPQSVSGGDDYRIFSQVKNCY